MTRKNAIPELGDQLPRWGNRVSRRIGGFLLGLWGWRIENAPPNRAKWIGVVAPHTSNIDFFVGMTAIVAMGLRASWMAKHTLFRAPMGGLLKWLGGIPINRSVPRGAVDQIVDIFGEQERLVLGITPEGTRSRVEHWKTGFHHIARGAGVPVVLVYFDYSRKVLGFGRIVEPGEDVEKDIREIREFYDTITPRRPENFGRLSEQGGDSGGHEQTA